MKSLRLLLLAALATAVIVGASTASAASSSSSSTFAFDLLKFTPTGYVDVAPKQGINKPSAGDTLTATSAIYDTTGRHRLGRTSELCVVTVARPMTMDCSFGLIFSSGSELLVRGAFNPEETPWRASVVGGYGRYAGARGWVRETNLNKGERMSVTLTP
jgi:hypothetical protein